MALASSARASVVESLSPDSPPLAHETELPGYTPRSQNDLTEHICRLDDSKGRAWLWLKIKSRSRESTQLPLFYNHDTISGSVELDFDQSQGVRAVIVSVVAGVTAVGQDEIRFLDLPQELWKFSSNKDQVKGRHSWSFSIALPDEAIIPEGTRNKQEPKAYPLPPSFSERASPAYIDYRVVVNVKKTSFRVKQTLSSNFAYMPITRASPPSVLRQLAYREGTSLLGPEGDPQGWKVLSPVVISGSLFNTRNVMLTCTLAIATPLTYALGSPIPIMLTLRGSDAQALDLLATRSAAQVQLARVRLVGSHATLEDVEYGRSNNSFAESFGSASFWPYEEGRAEPDTRVLQGELEVRRSLKPQFVFPRFSLRYVLLLLQFQAPGFAPAAPSNGSEPLILERVTITSANAPGIAPRSYAPPGYVETGEGDYNTTVGYLENGNQRFLHHHGFA